MTAVGDVLTALADPTRRALLEHLSMHGYASATTLADELPVSRQAIVQHLAILDAVGLVADRRAGREHQYAVRTSQLVETARWMERVAAQWDRRLEAIRRIAEAEDAAAGSPVPPVHGAGGTTLSRP